MSQVKYTGPGIVHLTGRLSPRYQGNLQYLLNIYTERKGWMLEPFQNRGQAWVIEPLRNRKMELAWAGEYAGKWLDAASLTAAGSHNPELGGYASTFAADLIATQEASGYLGIEIPPRRAEASEWDNWNIKYAMTGLLTHYEVYHDETSRDAAVQCGEWLLKQYGLISGPDHPFFRSAMDGGVNASIVDQVVRLYVYTGERKFLDFASSIVSHFPPIVRMRDTHQAPEWHAYNLASILAGVVGLATIDHRGDELFWVEKVWEDIAARHLYPTGSIGYNELLQASAPNDTPVEAGQPARHHQETCATVEWLLLNAGLHLATGRARYVQRMEQTIYNALLAAQSEDGIRWMYFTPLRYEKQWFAGQTSCCYWSGPRGIARLPGWVFALDEDGIHVNLFESCNATIQLPDEHSVTIDQSCSYPDGGRVTLEIQPEIPLPFTLRLRMPTRGSQAKLMLNGNPIPAVMEADGYFSIHRRWLAGDRIEMEFDVLTTVRDFLGEQYGVVVRGPEVLSVDQRDNVGLDLDKVFLPKGMILESTSSEDCRRRYLGEMALNGRPAQVIFTPYADAGGEGSRFRTAFPVSEKFS